MRINGLLHFSKLTSLNLRCHPFLHLPQNGLSEKQSPGRKTIRRVGNRKKNDPASLILVLAVLSLVSCSSDLTTPLVMPPTRPAETATMKPSVNTPTQVVTTTLTPSPASTLTFQVTLDAVGDLMLARTVGDQILAQGPQVVFAGVQSVLDQADLRIGNLECAITDRTLPEKKSFPLKAPLQAVQALSLGKIDLVSLANNHAMDYGYAGLEDGQSLLDQSGIASVGAGADFSAAHAPVIIQRNGLRLAFLAYADVMPENSGFDAHTWIATNSSPGIAWADPAQIMIDVSAARLQADLVIVMLHSGYEINSTVSADQRAEAHAAIDSGATLVIGSHPHLLQTIEKYHGGLIAYSLGNFVFDQYLGIANATIILRVTLTREGLQTYDYVPVLIENGLPTIIPIDKALGIQTLVAP
jgi:poly-gamma-glutamate capsule biosynthesis protein CapA/YwtB (metallophosphatase superfamily)